MGPGTHGLKFRHFITFQIQAVMYSNIVLRTVATNGKANLILPMLRIQCKCAGGLPNMQRCIEFLALEVLDFGIFLLVATVLN